MNKPWGYWSKEKLIKKLERLINELGHFPTEKELRKLEENTLPSQIRKYLGGFPKAREIFGFEEIIKAPNHYYESWKNLESELKKIISEIGHFPTDQELRSLGKSNISFAISKYHGGMGDVRQKFNLNPLERKKGYWKDWNNVKKELTKLISEFGHFPTHKELNEIGMSSLSATMSRYHGGSHKIRKRLDSPMNIKPMGYWKDWNNVERELTKLISEIDHFPKIKELYDLGQSSLSAAISTYHGGFDRVRKIIGYRSERKHPGYWKNFDNVKKELKPIIEKLNRFPTYYDLKEINPKLLIGISKHHGLKNTRRMMGYNLINTNEQFINLLKKDETAKNLAVAAVSLNGEAVDVEKIITEIYDGKFKDESHLHNLLEGAANEIYDLISDGITNLGAYLGEFSFDRNIIPVLIGQAITSIPEERITDSLEERLVRILRVNYSPRFNEDPYGTVKEVKGKVDSSEGKKKRLYERLYNHYQEVLKLGEELKCLN